MRARARLTVQEPILNIVAYGVYFIASRTDRGIGVWVGGCVKVSNNSSVTVDLKKVSHAGQG